MGLNQQRREGFAVIYRNKPQFKGLDTYLRLAPQATSKRVNIGEATVFASESEAQRYAKDFAKAPDLNQDDAAVVPIVEEVVRRHAVPPLAETITQMMAGARNAG